MSVNNHPLRVYRVFNPHLIPTQRFKSKQVRKFAFWIVFGVSAWLTHTYANWSTTTNPNLFREYISYQHDINGTDAIIVSSQQFRELSWFMQQIWWVGDFVREALDHWYHLPMIFAGSLISVAVLSACIREVFGLNLLSHNERTESLFVKVDQERYETLFQESNK